jgi:hypothetical protein
LGLCKAGVAVGCDTGTGPATACEKIEQNFEDAVGGPAPWVAECLCDFSLVSLQLDSVGGPWLDTATNEFVCTTPLPDTFSGTQIQAHLSDLEIPPSINGNTWLRTTIYYDESTHQPIAMGCTAIEENSLVWKESLVIGYMGTTAQDILNMGRVCLRDFIAYGSAFDALNPGVIDTNQCN